MTLFNVKAAAQLIGLSPHTLRAWEKRYKAIVPKRSGTGRRLYSLEEVERLKLLAQLVYEGHAISEIAKRHDSELRELVKTKKGLATKPSLDRPHEEYLQNILKSVSGYKFEQAQNELIHAQLDLSIRDFLLHVVSPVLSDVGELVMSGKFSVAHEHALSNILRDQLGAILRSVSTPMILDSKKVKHTLVLTTVEGDLHEFGILIGAILCCLHRVRPQYLGPNLPAADLIQAVKNVKPTGVLLGTTEMPQAETKVSIDRYLKQIDASLPKEVLLWVGGSGLRHIKKQDLQHPVDLFPTLDSLDFALRKLSTPT